MNNFWLVGTGWEKTRRKWDCWWFWLKMGNGAGVQNLSSFLFLHSSSCNLPIYPCFLSFPPVYGFSFLFSNSSSSILFLLSISSLLFAISFYSCIYLMIFNSSSSKFMPGVFPLFFHLRIFLRTQLAEKIIACNRCNNEEGWSDPWANPFSGTVVLCWATIWLHYSRILCRGALGVR